MSSELSPLDDLLLSADKLDLLDELLRAEGIVGPASAEPIRPRPDPGVRPLSFAEERLWFLHQLAPDSPAYNLPCAVRLAGRLDAAALAGSLAAIVERHETLRTRFADRGGAPAALIEEGATGAGLSLPRVDLAGLAPEGRQREALRLAGDEARRPFDLARGPVWRGALLRLAGDEHWLLLTLHHIAADGWSVEVLLRELRACYPALAAGRPAALPPLPVQYADFAHWQREYLAGPAAAPLEAYWQERLAGLPENLDLPVDRSHPAAGFRGLRHTARLPADLAARWADLARRQRTTLFSSLLAGFAALLQAYSGQDDLAIGAPVANRDRVGTEELIGFFVNTLVLRLDLAGDPDLLTLLARVWEVVEGAQAHQDLPFDRLVARLAPERQLHRTPLVRVMFTLQGSPLAEARLPGLALTPLDLDTGSAKLDLLLMVIETPDGLTASLEHSADLFDAATGQRLLQHFAVLLDALAAAPERPISQASLLAPWERQQVQAEWNDTRLDLPAGGTLDWLFAARAAAAPEAVAVVCGDAHLTYGALDRGADRLARALRRRGVGPDVPVGLLLGRSPALAPALLAILKAGGAYLPLDPADPGERLASLVRLAGAPLVVAGRRADWPPEGGEVPLFCLDEEAAALAREPAGAPEAAIGLDHLAYVLFTSGSTGQPKAVGATHRGVVRLVLGAGSFGLDLSPRETLLQLAPLSFDASTLEIWGALLTGGRLVLMPRGPFSLEEIGGAVEHQGVTTLWLTAGLFHQMVEAQLPQLRSLRRLLAGGDVVSPPHVRRTLRELPGVRLIDGYGPTENTTFTCCQAMAREEEVEAPVPIGRPIAGTTVYLLDRQGRPAPIGVAGELTTAGNGLARGYLGQPALTAERFVPHPFPALPGERLYRTGDLARRRRDGTVEFLGRRDRQIKVRGFRVEPGEVEAALCRHPRVRQAAVVARPDGSGGRRLAAYVVARSAEGDGGDGGDVAAELRGWLAERLPPYLVPASFRTLPALPLNANGKLDERALPEPASPLTESDPARHAAPPRTPLEEIVAALWEELLGRPPGSLGRDDSFFAEGGHSLLATRAISRVRQSLGREIPLLTLFEAPTVATFAARLEEVLRARPERDLPPLVPVPRDCPLPLSFAQQRFWFLDRLRPGDSAYNVPAAFRLRGPLAVDALERALAGVVRRHEALRTRFALAPTGDPVQEVLPAAALPLPRADLAALPGAAREPELARLLGEEARRPFDLGRGPLVRALLLRLAPAEHALAVTLHHIIADGWSAALLAQEVSRLYAGSPVPELPCQYADFASWQRTRLAGDRLETELAWWRGRLTPLPPPLDLPADRPRPAVASSRGGSRAFALPAELADRLAASSRGADATLFMTLLAGYQAVLHRWSGQADFAVGSPVANRTRAETESLIGCFVNTLTLRADLAGDPVFHQLLARVRDSALGAYAHQDVPFEKLVEELVPRRDSDRPPLFQVTFSLNALPPPELALPGLTAEMLPNPGVGAKFDLALTLAAAPDGLAGWLEHSADLFDAATADRLAGHLGVLLAAVVDPGQEEQPGLPHRPITELPLLTATEIRQLLVDWTATGTERFEAEGEATLAVLLAAQVERTPEATALVVGDERLTYRDLAGRAAALARVLRALGVGPEERVAVCAERNADLVVALLAVLSAGGAYVPIDPSYPRERQLLMLEDSRAMVLLTQERLVETLPPTGARVVLLDRPLMVVSAVAAAPLLPDHLAYLIYTSGSTGRPKGVAIAHRSAVALVRWARRAYSDAELAGVLWATSVCFDLSVFELFVPLCQGGTVILAENALALPNLPARDEVTLVNTVPSTLAELIRAGGVPASVKTINLAGEALQQSLVDRIDALGTVERLWNLYGPSEDTTYSTGTLTRAGAAGVTIGTTLPGGRAFVVDRKGRPMPVGVPGELLLAGTGLARGYFDRPDLTAERFVPDAWPDSRSGEAGARAYRTGDLVRWLPRSGGIEGELEFLGRIDHQVKVRGFRIELGEIEAALAAHPEVREAAVLVDAPAPGETPGDARLIAFVVPHRTPGPAAADLRTALAARLPAFLIPARFVPLSELPRTPNGKLDRQALLRALPAAALPVAGEGQPRSPVEELLVGLWQEILRLPAAGVEDDFFAAGGHSLLATRLVLRIQDTFGVEVPLRQIFATPTPAALAPAVERALDARSGAAASPTPPITPVPRHADLPLSFAQQRIWLADQTRGGSPFYNQPLAVELQGALDLPVLLATLGEIARRHEALRTVFTVRGGRPVQVVRPPVLALPVVDLTALPAARRADESRRLADAEAQRPFDLARQLPLRLALLATGEGAAVLLFTLHHIAGDGWSTGVLMREVAALYEAFRAGRPSPLAELPVQYADFAVWQRDQLRGETLAGHLDFWRQALAGGPPALRLSTDRPRPAVPGHRGARLALPLTASAGAEHRDRLLALARGERVTLFMLLLAAFDTLLHRLLGEDDLMVGAAVAGRGHRGIEGLIGCFINLLPLRVSLAGDPTFRELLGRVRDTALGAFAHQDLPFELLAAELGWEREAGGRPLVQVAFGVQNAPRTAAELPGLALRFLELDPGTARFELTLWIHEEADGLLALWTYDTDLFDRGTVERLHRRYADLLDSILADPGQRIATLALAAVDEQNRRLAAWQDAKAARFAALKGTRRRPAAASGGDQP